MDVDKVGAVRQQCVEADRFAVFADAPRCFKQGRVHVFRQADVAAHAEFVCKDGGLAVAQAEAAVLHHAGDAFGHGAAAAGLARIPRAVGGLIALLGPAYVQRAVVRDLVVPDREAGGQNAVPLGAKISGVDAVMARAAAVLQAQAHGGHVCAVKVRRSGQQGVQVHTHERAHVGQEQVGFAQVAQRADIAAADAAVTVFQLDIQLCAAVVVGGVVELQFKENVIVAGCACVLAVQIDKTAGRGQRQQVVFIRRLARCPAVGLGDLQVFCLRFIVGFDCSFDAFRFGNFIRSGVIERQAAGFDIPGGVFHRQRLAGGRLRFQEHLKAAEVVHHRAENLLIDRGGIDLFCDLEQVLLGEVEGDAEVGGVQTALHVKHG